MHRQGVLRIAERSEKKKLREAGAYWAGERVVDETADDLKAFGAPAAVVESTETKEDRFEVFPENWRAIALFRRASTQWIVGVGGAVGLNYQSLSFLFKIYKVKNRRRMFEKIQDIEAGALEAFRRMNERKPGSDVA
jgi:ribosomal protein S18 acetylase RimI-like enzyme